MPFQAMLCAGKLNFQYVGDYADYDDQCNEEFNKPWKCELIFFYFKIIEIFLTISKEYQQVHFKQANPWIRLKDLHHIFAN